MVLKLNKGRMDENVVTLFLETISDLEHRLRKVEKQVEVLIQEIYGFRVLEKEENVVSMNKVEKFPGSNALKEERVSENENRTAQDELEVKKESNKGKRVTVPTVKLAS